MAGAVDQAWRKPRFVRRGIFLGSAKRGVPLRGDYTKMKAYPHISCSRSCASLVYTVPKAYPHMSTPQSPLGCFDIDDELRADGGPSYSRSCDSLVYSVPVRRNLRCNSFRQRSKFGLIAR
jgi:hypothetical protein